MFTDTEIALTMAFKHIMEVWEENHNYQPNAELIAMFETCGFKVVDPYAPRL